MSLMRPIVQIASLVLAAAVLVTAQRAVAGSQYVVLSTEPVVDELPPGKIFMPGDVINVPAGAVVTLLGEDGSVNPISGPAALVVTEDALTSGSPQRASDGQSGPSSLALIASLLTNERRRTESIGSARTTADQSKPTGLDDPWAISIEESAPGCIRNGEVVLARRGIGESAVFSVRLGSGQSLNGLVWSAGKPTYSLSDPIPADVKSLVVETNKTSALIEIKALPENAVLENPLEVLGWMVSSGCKRQALAFVRQLVTRQH
ncbi:hypothetical protein EN828_19260 [Mesorhizobium sp. M2D.F.Ca.ET.185.01.1.1]|uniref:hypothetical protein n=1 Tax=unclassified Mesorhizobium TaxID=325217 RepID=UPI000FCC3713|nr:MULTISPECIES: hypothetical protein [unclassified Mesorhizobium]TGP79058.1 hypothetical protein EN870_16475 [bacterium M00.F.Ca.ET.227.01.1.1]TGP89414.1 hypothetical protein EN864_19870 [bacterium M00.F.Ca.ET.221.01.1.1]TGP94784.1 hypothetical protein EN865_15740 [bacterium M00.F.Ca.ET.222.01.1.1]TGU03498.1 hypothetical protein EN806_42055 [bacterium M00.F.Ca.ET.163.01.1.1]TGU28410.1 hypothetical protein EN799_36675 [bacterium M00.F.Ca.ET.156.01.1.1]TGU45771.1 hypothetical protein EN789_169